MRRTSRIVYVTSCCHVKGTKPACEATEKADSTLGHWRCSKCKKSATVTPMKEDK